jgi:diguanylate cyclase (GGDEF)-like protein
MTKADVKAEGGGTVVEAPCRQGGGHLIGSDKQACVECWGCVRYCPAKAIRVVDRHSEVIDEKCVACGLCVSECGHSGHCVRDDTPAVRELLASSRPVVAVLASEFVAALHPMRPVEIERALEALGFYAVESTVLGEEMVALAYANLCKRAGAFPVLRSTCPVTVEWVKRYHPALVQALAPIVPPYVAQARLVREVYPDDVAVVYVSPCFARKDECFDPQFEGAVDVAIDFDELRALIEEGRSAEDRTRGNGGQPGGTRRPSPIKELSLTDGFPRDLLASRSALDNDVTVIRGLRAVDGALYSIEHGEAGPLIGDMLMCEGCIDGPTVNPGMSLSAKRNVEAAERDAHARSVVSSRALLRHLPDVELVRAFKPRPVAVRTPGKAETDRILAEGGFESREATIDCGACGYESCVEHAVAIYQGNSTWDLCFPLQRRLLESKVRQLEEHRTLDELTGLWNRRVFAERLVDEMARFDRYETPVSLLMLDVDRFRSIEQRHGERAGGEVLEGIAKHLRALLRACDLPSRYDADRFAIILPGIRKTGAFAVAEKLRTALAALQPPVTADGYTHRVPVTVSVGVASAGPSVTDAGALIEAADGALYQAKESGRDQVRLA